MEVNYFSGINGYEPKSMVVCKNNLFKELKNKIDIKENSMNLYNLPFGNFNYIKNFNRSFIQPFVMKRFISKNNHILDQSHAGIMAFKGKNKFIITVHDIYPLYNHGYYSFKITSRFIKKADQIIADSYNTKKSLIKNLKINKEKIRVIYNGVDHNIFRPLKVDYEKFNINRKKKIILHVGSEEERKNFTTIIKAFYNLQNKIKNIFLIKVGKILNKDLLLIKKLNLERNIINFKNISENALVNLYNLADLFVFPSLYEGFGLPVLEAMACGCPVISSNKSALPEVAGDAFLPINNPLDPYELAESIYEILTNKSLEKYLIKKGFKQAENFSWKKNAKQTLDIYEEVFS